jgi:hypothetical protein
MRRVVWGAASLRGIFRLMVRSVRIALLMAAAALIGLTSAQAQLFDSIFGAPRPPAGVPNGRQPQPYPQYPDQSYQRYPQSDDDRYPSARQPYGPQANVPVNPPPAVQTQPLPPPPGIAAVGPNDQPGQPGALPGQRLPGVAPADTGPPPADEVVVEPPAQKIANKTALFSGLDKITGRIINFDVAIGETVQFGALQVTPRACYTRPPTETANTDAFIEVDEVTLQGEVKRIFTGWMFATSPSLHAVEHPIYDVWLTDCKNPAVAPAPVAEVAPPAAAPPQPSRPAAAPAPKRPQQRTPPPR